MFALTATCMFYCVARRVCFFVYSDSLEPEVQVEEKPTKKPEQTTDAEGESHVNYYMLHIFGVLACFVTIQMRTYIVWMHVCVKNSFIRNAYYFIFKSESELLLFDVGNVIALSAKLRSRVRSDTMQVKNVKSARHKPLALAFIT